MQESVGFMRHQSNSGSGGKDGPQLINCVDGHQTKILEVWTFIEDGFTREVHPTAWVDVRTGFVGKFATHYLTST